MHRRPKSEDISEVPRSAPQHHKQEKHTMSNTNNKKTVLVLGATGKQGGQVISELLAQDANFSIRALSRNPESASAKSLTSRGVQVFKGDLDAADGLQQALTGVDTAFLVTLPDLKDHQKEATQGIRFVDEAKKANISHLIFTSVEDADKNTGVPHFETKWAIEKHIREVGIPWTILRPVAFMDNFTPNPSTANFVGFGVFSTLLGDHSLHWVHTRDIGRAAVRAIQNPTEYRGKIVPLAGDIQTFDGVLDAYEKVHGYRPWKAYVPNWAAKWLPQEFTKMFQFFREKGYSTDVAACRKADPQMYTVEKWLTENKKLVLGREGGIVVYDLKTATKYYTLVEGDQGVTALSFSPNGKAYSIADNLLRVWTTQTHFLSILHSNPTVQHRITIPETKQKHLSPLNLLDQVKIVWQGEKTVQLVRQWESPTLPSSFSACGWEV